MNRKQFIKSLGIGIPGLSLFGLVRGDQKPNSELIAYNQSSPPKGQSYDMKILDDPWADKTPDQIVKDIQDLIEVIARSYGVPKHYLLGKTI